MSVALGGGIPGTGSSEHKGPKLGASFSVPGEAGSSGGQGWAGSQGPDCVNSNEKMSVSIVKHKRSISNFYQKI